MVLLLGKMQDAGSNIKIERRSAYKGHPKAQSRNGQVSHVTTNERKPMYKPLELPEISFLYQAEDETIIQLDHADHGTMALIL